MTSRGRRPKRPRFLACAGLPLAAGGVSAAVFDVPGAGHRRDAWIGVGIALGLMLGLGARAATLPPHARVAAVARPKLIVELFEAPPPPVVEPPKPPPEPPSVRPRAAPQAAAPAQAAQVVAQPAPADEALDLTGFTIATGTGPQYAGGKTASTGTSTQAVTGAVAPDGVKNGSGDLSRGIRLPDDEWDCPWPAEAEALGIDQQTVVLRVSVRADAALESAVLVQDPGNGFGAAALACARRSRFDPARDPAGNPIAARSAPIRVLFTR